MSKRPNEKRAAEKNAHGARRVRRRRRLTLGAGLGVMLATAAAAVALGTGCIFDEGNYQGGGRRSTAPTATDTTTSEPTATSTPTVPTNKPPGDSGQAIPDTGAPD